MVKRPQQRQNHYPRPVTASHQESLGWLLKRVLVSGLLTSLVYKIVFGFWGTWHFVYFPTIETKADKADKSSWNQMINAKTQA
jgi:hypothetical protein